MGLSIGYSEQVADSSTVWAIECVNCGSCFATTPYDARAFCSRRCQDTARAVRYGRTLVARFGPTRVWTDEVLLGAVGRVPVDVVLADMNRRWEAQRPEKACDDEDWNDSFQAWVAANRRQARLAPTGRSGPPSGEHRRRVGGR
jgi:hypothetical protein